jgi:hypothetical protein
LVKASAPTRFAGPRTLNLAGSRRVATEIAHSSRRSRETKMAVRAQPGSRARGQLLSEFLAPEVGLPRAPYAAQAIKMTLGRHLASTRWCFDRRCALSEKPSGRDGHRRGVGRLRNRRGLSLSGGVARNARRILALQLGRDCEPCMLSQENLSAKHTARRRWQRGMLQYRPQRR